MITGLLEITLDRIASLEHFYYSEYESIETKSREGMVPNSYGFLVCDYLQRLSRGYDFNKLEETKKQKETVEGLIDIIEEKKSDGSTKIRYEIKDRALLVNAGFELDIHKARRAFSKFAEMPTIHANNTLITLITRFEDFISRLISCVYKMYPQQYLDKQTISFSEIVDCGVNEIREKIVYREVDAMMRKSYTEWFKLFEGHGFSFTSCKTEMDDLKEIYARRNIIVHNEGKVNDIYLKNTGKTNAKIGEVLDVDRTYLKKAFHTIRIIVFSIMIEATKIVQSDKDEYLYSIFSIAFELLKQREYMLCKHVFCAIKQNKYGSESTRKLSQVNYWLAQKGLNGIKSIEDEVRKFDVSALSKEFSMAKQLLLDNYDEATALVTELFDKGDVTANVLQEWPLFIDYRETEQYKAFQQAHPDEFNIEMVEVNSPETEDSTAQTDIINNALDSVVVTQ